MKQGIFTIRENTALADSVLRMVLEGDTSAITAPGQFVNIKLDGRFLRRPISVCDWDRDSITLIYKVAGSGTEDMSHMSPGERLDLLTGLGNGYDLSKSGSNPLLIGGGVGIPPLYGLCRRLIFEGKRPVAVLGFNTVRDIYYTDEFTAIGAEVRVATVDGSVGTKGLVTHAMPTDGFSYFYTCGPTAMLKAVYDAAVTDGQFSFEERMGCGFGACMGCSCETKYGSKRICRDGPVLEKEEIIW